MSFEWYHVPLALLGYCTLYALLSWLFPGLLRPVWWLIVHALHRFHVYGRQNIPAGGPVLIVSNHVTYIDWMFLWLASPRPLTYVLWSGYKRHWVLRLLLSFVRGRAHYIDSRDIVKPHSLTGSLETIAKALAAGRAVMMFPEGRLTRNGQMLPFQRGLEQIVERAGVPVPIVPACLWNLWGSLLSWKHGRVLFRWPEGFRRRIAVSFGEPLPGHTKTADVRAAVVECWADCGTLQSEYVIPVHSGFVRKGAAWINLRRVAFVDASAGTDRALTWPKAFVGAWCLAKYLKGQLGTDEKVVGVWLPTGLGSAFANIALAFLHRTSVNLNYTAGSRSVRSAVDQTGIQTIITAKRFIGRMPLDLPDTVRRIYLEDALAAIPKSWKVSRLLLVLLLPGWFLDRVVLRCRRFGWDDLLTIIFSSGSTGDPKGVMLTLRNISCNADGFQKGVNFTRHDRMLCTLPTFHSFGYTVCLWAPASIGMMSVFYPDPRAAKEVGELCQRWKCSIVLGTATFVRFYLRRCVPEHFQSSRLFICGAEKLPVSLALEFQAKFGVLPLEGYGCTELSPVVSANLIDVTVAGVKQFANAPGTVGQPIPGVVAKAFHPDTQAPLPVGTEGLLCVKGSNAMLGYWQQPEKTQASFIGKWYITGDMGHIEPEGFIRITGRLSRFAKIAGEMVPLEKIEEELHDTLATAGERVLAVAAVADNKRGERLIVLHLIEAGARLKGAFESLRTKGLPNLWIPDLRDCFAVEALPVLGSGKLDLRGVQELAKKIAG